MKLLLIRLAWFLNICIEKNMKLVSLATPKLGFCGIWVLAWHAAVEMTVMYVNGNGNCFLFGSIDVQKRHLLPSRFGICESVIVYHYGMGLFTFAFICAPLFQGKVVKRIRVISSGLLLLSTSFAVFFAAGFRYVCGTLDQRYTPSCSYETLNNLEWKYFVPKYVSGSHMADCFFRIEVSSWLCAFLWFCIWLCSTVSIQGAHRTHLDSF